MKFLFTTLLLFLSASFAYSQTLWSRAKINSDNGAKYGIVLTDGSWLIEPNYDDIRTITNGGYHPKWYFMVEEDDKYGLLDSTGKTILTTSFDIIKLSNQFIWVDIDGKCGAYSFSGRKMLNTKYEQVINGSYQNHVQISPQREYIGFGTEGHFGLVDTSGNVIVPPNYDYIIQKSGFYSVRKNGILDLYSRFGVKLNTARFTDFDGDHSERSPRGYIKAKSNGKWGMIDSIGNVVLEPVYSDIYMNKSYVHLVSSHWKGIALYSGEVILEPIYNSISTDEGKRFFCYLENGKYGLSTTTGKPVLLVEYDEIRISSYHIEIKKDGKYGICDKDGQIILEAEYETVSHEYGSPIITYNKNGKFGAVDTNARKIAAPIYDELRVSRNWILAKLNGKISGFNFNGDVLFTSVDDIRCINNVFFYKKNDRWGAVNIEGKEVIPPLYSQIGYSMSYGPLPVKKGNKWGYISAKGETVIPFMYDTANDFSRSGARVTKNGKKTNIDENNKPFQNGNNPFASWGSGGSGGGFGTGAGPAPIVDYGRNRLSHLPKLQVLSSNGNIGLKDKETTILPPEYSKIIVSQHPVLLAQKNERWGAFDLIGKPLLEMKYAELTPFLPFGEHRAHECAVYSNQSTEPEFIESSKESKATWPFYETLFDKQVQHNGFYSNLHQRARFPEGSKAMEEFIRSEMKFPRKARKLNTIATVYAKCIVEVDGQISSIKVDDPMIESSFIKEAKRIIQAMPPFHAGRYYKNNEEVRSQITVQVIFDPTNFKKSN